MALPLLTIESKMKVNSMTGDDNINNDRAATKSNNLLK
tara:strand:+ start:413 stop:526 length:114 start_codon:yes stop_codon:yes gene_type:complete